MLIVCGSLPLYSGLAPDFELQARDPIRHLLRVLVDRTCELDVLVFRAAGDPMDIGVFSALFVLKDVVLDGEAVAFGPVAEVGAAVQFDPKTQALGGWFVFVCHPFLLSAGRSGSLPVPDRR